MGKLIRLGEFALQDVLPSIAPDSRLTVQTAEGKSYSVGTESVRLQCFKKNLSCVKCGLTGSKFCLEQHVGNIIDNPHFNLYAVNDEGEDVLMTKDHIIPASKGGSNELRNMQTMCGPCNVAKGTKSHVYVVVAGLSRIVCASARRSSAEKFVEQQMKYKQSVNEKMNQLNLDVNDDEAYMEAYHELTLEVPEQYREYLASDATPYIKETRLV